MKDVKEIARSSRYEFVARIAWELIIQVYATRKEPVVEMEKEVELGGFSWGGNMIGT